MSTPQQKTRVRIHGGTQRFKRFAFLLLLGAVLISLTTATANFAGAANSTGAQPVVGATTHPIQYWIGCAPSMVTTTNLNYFKQQGFTAVVMVVPDSQTYQAQLTTIKSLNMLPIIDIEMPIWDGGQLQSTPISHFAGYFQSLKTAGWQYVASEGGRPGDLAYLQNYFKGYVNFNCDQCGLWQNPGNPVYTNSFTVANSWESYYPSEWSSIQTGAKQAAALGIQNGILAGTWANSGGDNQIYANSVSGSGSPSYLSMLNWSYANGIGFTSFHVWCGDNPDGLSQYKSLGFDKIVAAMQVYYPATKSASLGTGAAKQSTQLTLTASNTSPAVNQSVTFTATLKSGTTPISEPVTIYHYLNGVRYNDITAYSTLTFATKSTSPGARTYYATFAGDSAYAASTSSVVTINVAGNAKAQTSSTLSASNTSPAVSQSDTFTATLKDATTPISEPVTIYHYLSGVRYNDTTGYSTLTFATKWTSPGARTYYASFAGDNAYQTSTSSAVTINVKALTALTLSASNTSPAVSQSDTFTATLKDATTPISEPVTIYHYLSGVRYNDTTGYSTLTFATKWTSPGARTYYASFAGDSAYAASTSSAVTINVKAQTKPQTSLTLSASNTSPAVSQSDTFTATLKDATTPISEPVTIYHYLNGVRYNDTTGYSTLTFATKWTTPGTRTYYASFAGDSSYQASTSSAVTVNVISVKTSASSAVTVNVTSVTNLKTGLTIAAPASALMKQNFTINGTLSASALGIGNATITMQRSTDNATWTNVTTNVTNTPGGYQFSNNETVANTYYYRTAYDGNATYGNATSTTVNVNVTKMSTALTLTASNATPAINHKVNFTVTLTSGSQTLSSKSVTIYDLLNGVRYNDTTNVTNAKGQITLITSWASAGTRTYYASFAGDSSYLASTSSAVTVTVQ